MVRDVYRFGAFTLDVGERRLSAGNTVIRLPPKTFDVLAILTEHQGRLLTKHELLARVWPETFVDEGILTVHVAALRKALGDERQPRAFIETVPRSGYRFVAEVVRESPGAPGPPDEPRRPPEVYASLGRGRRHLLSGSYDDLPHAVEAFRDAIALDPTYAPAHAGLARARCAQAVLRAVPHQEAFADAKVSALRALAMDGGTAEAQVALGTVLFLAEWDWIGAERSLQRALDIDPDHVEALLQYASLYEALGRLDEALRLKQQALTREPRSPHVHVHIAHSYWYRRRFDEALRWAGQALDADPHHLLASVFVGGIYWQVGDIDRFLAQMTRIAMASGATGETVTNMTARMRQVYVKGGHAGLSAFLADEIGFMATVPFRRAVLYGAAGRLDEAFDALDLAIAERDPSTVHLAVAPELDPLRPDPRFAARLHLMALPSVA